MKVLYIGTIIVFTALVPIASDATTSRSFGDSAISASGAIRMAQATKTTKPPQKPKMELPKTSTPTNTKPSTVIPKNPNTGSKPKP
ncbi:MAG: hypothetical protein KJZ73_06140 [Pseudorhodoplanes sp.]|nr:hypothetical protein [Pseudorhodoplanes sp.]MBW7949782.1 hypothetical protein [Pseudorhodoplanes sp.]MCL4710810.1 hypothetical protein [Pseudorhodoplanes sp.]